ncbi:hypothetical protein E1A91_D09G056500v1 [Gossypium mustelinum]|uniref:Uncharacterized protein n=1 Tax=Gossypium mustelinum TaxID=34275 RepID=A0A5D2TFV6_GOSMU|nr:hypothetical protein E1A91_D09G056500v1 [Gossypium mustelinum]
MLLPLFPDYSLNCVGGMEAAVMQKQMDSLQTILLSMKNTMEDFRGVVLSLEKLQYDGKQLAKGSSNHKNKKQLQHRIGVKPTLTNCIDGLVLLHEIYHDEQLTVSSFKNFPRMYSFQYGASTFLNHHWFLHFQLLP